MPAQPPAEPCPQPADALYLRPYLEALRCHGATFEATLWASRAMQQERFAVMADMVDLSGRLVLDAGCGLGDLASYLGSRDGAYARYFGIEALPQLVEAALRRGLPDASFEAGDFVADRGIFARLARHAPPDVVVFSGSLNTLTESEAKDVLARAWDVCGEALLFNFLSDRIADSVESDQSPAKRFNAIAMLDWALNLTPRVRFRQDYFDGHDATIAMFKPPRHEPAAGLGWVARHLLDRTKRGG